MVHGGVFCKIRRLPCRGRRQWTRRPGVPSWAKQHLRFSCGGYIPGRLRRAPRNRKPVFYARIGVLPAAIGLRTLLPDCACPGARVSPYCQSGLERRSVPRARRGVGVGGAGRRVIGFQRFPEAEVVFLHLAVAGGPVLGERIVAPSQIFRIAAALGGD